MEDGGGVTPLRIPGEGLNPGTETVLVEPQIQANQCSSCGAALHPCKDARTVPAVCHPGYMFL